jgi:hypothetical protein
LSLAVTDHELQRVKFENQRAVEWALMRHQEIDETTIAKIKNVRAIEIAKRLLMRSLSVDIVAEATELSLDLVKKLTPPTP